MTYWMIEWPASPNSPSRWWNPDTGWMMDPLLGVRFCREQDARSVQKATRAFGPGITVTEHAFIEAAEQSNTTLLSALGKAREALGPFEGIAALLFGVADDRQIDLATHRTTIEKLSTNISEAFVVAWLKARDFRRAQSTLTELTALLTPGEAQASQPTEPNGDTQ